MYKTDAHEHAAGVMDRRSFLRLSGLLGLGAASAAVLPTSAEAVKFNRQWHKVSSTKIAMGTFVSMTLIHPSAPEAEEAMGRAFEEIDRLMRILTRFDDATAIGQLNRDGKVEDVPPEVAEVLFRALDYYRISGGVFDVSVKPVIDLFVERLSTKNSAPPSESEIQNVLRLVGSNRIELQGRNIRFGTQGMEITLDGIAKGYIVDKASEVLSSHGITNHLINAGGDIRTSGQKGDTSPWTVAIQDPEKKKQYPDKIHMTDGAIATSGNYEIYFDQEKMYHHIIDPRTGLSPKLAASVSVLAKTAMDSDALSTSIFVMDPAAGTRFIESIPQSECYILSTKGDIYKSRGWVSAVS